MSLQKFAAALCGTFTAPRLLRLRRLRRLRRLLLRHEHSAAESHSSETTGRSLGAVGEEKLLYVFVMPLAGAKYVALGRNLYAKPAAVAVAVAAAAQQHNT